MADEIYLSRLTYDRNADLTTATVEFTTDQALTPIQINSQIAAELIKAIAFAGGLEIEITDTRRY